MKNNKIDKKLLENPFVGSLVVPIAIVLVGALVIFGVTKMISSEHDYKNLVREMKSKTFGNKWVAALELSKVIAAGKIPEEDIPWLIENMDDIYSNTIDSRTRDFIVVAVGALKNERGLKIITKALKDTDDNVKFHAVVSLGNMPTTIVYDWAPVIEFLNKKDYAMVQAATLALATHKVSAAESKMVELLKTELGYGVRYAAATGLVQFENETALTTIKEILNLDDKSFGGKIGTEDIRNLKLNVLGAAGKTKWSSLYALIDSALQKEKDIKIVAYGKEVLKLMKE